MTRSGDSESVVVGSFARPALRLARRRLVTQTRELIAAEPKATLRQIARQLAVSPHHLSRVFHAHTGNTISTYRNQLRVRIALEQLAEGEQSLTRLAHELGFSDHAHLTRTVKRQTGAPPSHLRQLFAGAKPR